MSAFILGKEHIDYLVEAGLFVNGHGGLTWLAPGEDLETDYQAGDWCGPTAMQSYKARHRELRMETADHVGQMLIRENHLSVNFRYDERPTVTLEDPYRFNMRLRPIDPVQVLKALNCYEYQSCEHPGWKTSEAKAFCDALRHSTIHRLPGYDDAEWEVR